jgi:pimeloyl-ACP methyl ester carboxylesterase
MFVVTAGRGSKPVVFVHGLGDSTLTWAAIVPELTRTCRVVAYDRPGMGASPPTSRARSLERMGTELCELLDALDERPAILVGHSLGGLIAMEAFRSRPELVAGLVLIDPADPGMLNRRALVAIQRLALGLPGVLATFGLWTRIARSTARREAAAAVAEREAQDALADALLENLLSPTARKTASAELSGTVQSLRGNLEGVESNPIDVPLTVLSATAGGTGRKSRAEWTERNRLLADASPGGRHVIVEGGHYLHRERPNAVAEVIRRQAQDLHSPN